MGREDLYDRLMHRWTSLTAALAGLAVAAASIAAAMPAQAVDRPSGTDGSFACSGGGTYHMTAGVVDGNSGCAGEALISSGATQIGDRAFNSASAVTVVSMSTSVTSIGESAFQASGLTSAVIHLRLAV